MGPQSRLAGRSLTDTALRRTTGALVLALRTSHGQFITTPADETHLRAGTILIVLGTSTQLDAVRDHATG
ncbi:cation:proton antiporter regulatory subunit [Nocardia wallacei]|uniref:cation:proton antiporter regulatory subunit n=1 Tax=Nocardia wallacei TaxID=480035 RepID=UPI002458331B|nr:TrkA C-terminal domain-containing protein [Nocardia wallacei]